MPAPQEECHPSANGRPPRPQKRILRGRGDGSTTNDGEVGRRFVPFAFFSRSTSHLLHIWPLHALLRLVCWITLSLHVYGPGMVDIHTIRIVEVLRLDGGVGSKGC